MHINDLCDDIILSIFSNFDLRTRRLAGETCRRWAGLSRKSWRQLRQITLHTMFEQPRMPKGKYLNKALHWVLKRCGRNLKILNLSDPEPEFRFVKANERTFRIIGRYCHELEEIDFTCLLLLNDLLREWVAQIDCTKIKRVNLNCSFSHYCAIYDGLSDLCNACPQIEYLNISNSLNARLKDCEELWPPTLKEVYINHALCLTGYSIWSLVRCCPRLRLFSMTGNHNGMDGGLKYVFSRSSELQILHLDEYPGDTQLGMQMGQLTNLLQLHLSGSTMVNDRVIKAIAEGCRKLEYLDLSVPLGHDEPSRHGVLTDEGLLSLAYHAPQLKRLNIERRQFITDQSVSAILTNGRIEILSMAESDSITDDTLSTLGAYCSDRLKQLSLSRMSKISSAAILHLCSNWFANCTLKSGYRLEVHLDEMSIDIGDFVQTFRLVSEENKHEFTVDVEGRPRSVVSLYCDMLTTLYH